MKSNHTCVYKNQPFPEAQMRWCECGESRHNTEVDDNGHSFAMSLQIVYRGLTLEVIPDLTGDWNLEQNASRSELVDLVARAMKKIQA